MLTGRRHKWFALVSERPIQFPVLSPSQTRFPSADPKKGPVLPVFRSCDHPGFLARLSGQPFLPLACATDPFGVICVPPFGTTHGRLFLVFLFPFFVPSFTYLPFVNSDNCAAFLRFFFAFFPFFSRQKPLMAPVVPLYFFLSSFFSLFLCFVFCFEQLVTTARRPPSLFHWSFFFFVR